MKMPDALSTLLAVALVGTARAQNCASVPAFCYQTCAPYAYCLTPTLVDASCARAPPQCSIACASALPCLAAPTGGCAYAPTDCAACTAYANCITNPQPFCQSAPHFCRSCAAFAACPPASVGTTVASFKHQVFSDAGCTNPVVPDDVLAVGQCQTLRPDIGALWGAPAGFAVGIKGTGYGCGSVGVAACNGRMNANTEAECSVTPVGVCYPNPPYFQKITPLTAAGVPTIASALGGAGKKDDDNTGAIVGGAVGGVVVIVAIIALYLFCKKDKKSEWVGTRQAGTPPVTLAAPVGTVTASAVPAGARFDPNTGEPIPKFDPQTGKQNWFDAPGEIGGSKV